MKSTITGVVCFLLGALSLAFAQTVGLRPDQFIGMPWIWPGAQTFTTVVGGTNTQTGTTYTLQASDCGKTIIFTSGSAITLTTLNSLVVGCSIAVEQSGAGQVTIANGSGATSHSSHNYTKTFGQYAIIGLFVDGNSGGSAANLTITGDGAL